MLKEIYEIISLILKIRTASCLRTFLAEGNGVYFQANIQFPMLGQNTENSSL